MSSFHCRLTWNHVQVLPNQTLRPCCRYNPEYIDPEYKNGVNDINGSMRGKFMSKIRNELESMQIHKGCQKCFDEEASGKSFSIRKSYNTKNFHFSDFNVSSEPVLEFVELANNNTCNLKCAICTPLFSSKWNEDAKSVGYDKFTLTKYISAYELFKDHIPKLKLIKMTGGEPLLIKDYEVLLEKICEQGVSKNIVLNYSTNGTIAPSEKLIALWSQFRWVEISISLDGVGEPAEYSRFPLKWPVFHKNVSQFIDLTNRLDLRVGVRPSISIYNLFDLFNMADYWIDMLAANGKSRTKSSFWFNPTHVAFPNKFSIHNLPIEHKMIFNKMFDEKIENYSLEYKSSLQYIKNYMNSKEQQLEYWNEFVSFTKKLDEARKNSFVRVYPQFNNDWGL